MKHKTQVGKGRECDVACAALFTFNFRTKMLIWSMRKKDVNCAIFEFINAQNVENYSNEAVLVHWQHILFVALMVRRK